MKTLIKQCTCDNEMQDKQHGKRKRVMNLTLKKPEPIYRCTVCGKENK